MTTVPPYLSVIVPAHRGEAVLRRSLPALLASDLPRVDWELIVVDDASPDLTPQVAAEYADLVLTAGAEPRGPAGARNCGVQAARGEVVVFIDADVCVHPQTLRAIADAFRADAGLAALFGSYDADPSAPGVVSQFRNLLHHHVHHMCPGPAETFWAGCGAVRRDVYEAVGMMDEVRYPRPQIEDIELGRRLRRAGHRIELRPDIQGKHLKRWTLRSMVVTDFRDRGVPWMKLLLSEGKAGSMATLNLRRADKACTALVALIALALPAAAAMRSVVPLLLATAAAASIVMLNHRFYRLLLGEHGLTFALAAVPLHLVFYFTGGLGAVAGILSFHYERRGQHLSPATVGGANGAHLGLAASAADGPVRGPHAGRRP